VIMHADAPGMPMTDVTSEFTHAKQFESKAMAVGPNKPTCVATAQQRKLVLCERCST
jgi:hypothetical protein